jgi:hypothetical protein
MLQASRAVVLAYACSVTVLAPASSMVVFSDAHPTSLLGTAFIVAAVLTGSRATTGLPPTSSAVVLTYARSAAGLAPVSLTDVLADTRSVTRFA